MRSMDLRELTTNCRPDPNTMVVGETTVVYAFLSLEGVRALQQLLQACVDAGARVVTYGRHVELQGTVARALGGMLCMTSGARAAAPPAVSPSGFLTLDDMEAYDDVERVARPEDADSDPAEPEVFGLPTKRISQCSVGTASSVDA